LSKEYNYSFKREPPSPGICTPPPIDLIRQVYGTSLTRRPLICAAQIGIDPRQFARDTEPNNRIACMKIESGEINEQKNVLFLEKKETKHSIPQEQTYENSDIIHRSNVNKL